MRRPRTFTFFMVYGERLPAVVYVGAEPMRWRDAVSVLGRAVRALTGEAPGWAKGDTGIMGVAQEVEDPRAAFLQEWDRKRHHCVHIHADGTFTVRQPLMRVAYCDRCERVPASTLETDACGDCGFRGAIEWLDVPQVGARVRCDFQDGEKEGEFLGLFLDAAGRAPLAAVRVGGVFLRTIHHSRLRTTERTEGK